MPAALRTALSVVALVATNVAVGRLITGPLHDLPAEHRLNHDLRNSGGARTTRLAAVVSRSSDTSVAIGLGFALTAAMLVRGRRRSAAVPGLAMALASATHVTSSALVGRPRPGVEHLGTRQPTSSFPSGHVGAMTALAVTLDAAAAPLPGPARVTVRAGLAGYLALLGWSRLFNGQHYASDVLAGFANGLACGRLARRALAGDGR
ncbi:phosphatase PAP2 family protein [Micropruina sonneratiae]|uniref:phosphatase PAP2 family protein n=1 Tax=Micropruina sonneratiae TaxID=2986940 RepID=UPI0022262AEB|nr:phosphatase PAP2 family protein [Micropruina sp. KQZ13P-5]MCW3156686.1 phosphatase PAP2 family protein [Micropruina sp. KQZ13P-5]